MDRALKKLASSARAAALRARLSRALARAIAWLPLVLVYAAGALTYIKVKHPPAQTERMLLLVGAIPVLLWVAAVAHALFRRQPNELGASLLDRCHGLEDRLTNALAFASLPAPEQTPLMRVAMEDAVEQVKRVGKLSPRRAAPIRLPRELGIVLLLTGGLVAIALLEVPIMRRLPPPPAAPKPMVLTGDDVELFRDLAKELEEESKDAEALAAVRRFNQLIEDIAQRRLERKEVFKRLSELERDLSKASEAEKEATEEGLKGLAKELEKSELSKPVANALKDKRLADAEKAMRELAEKLKKKKKPPTKAQLDRLRKALERASKASSSRSQSLLKEREELEEQKKRLLKKKQEKGELSKQDQKKLDQLERRLERLDREQKKADKAKKKMSELDKKLAEAARELMKEAGAGAEDLESSAEDINRMSQEQMSDEEKKKLLKRLQEMRELMRQQGAGGQKRLQRLQRFGRKARGQEGQPGDGEGKGQGKGKGQGPGKIVIGPGAGGGVEVPMPGGGPGNQPGQPGGDQQGDGAPGGGKQWGTGHDDQLKGDQTALPKTQTHDVMAAGVDTGEGSASSEVISGAAQRGFVGRGYQKVYTDYKTVAERVMNDDEIPPGYRFYVRRYFQLIRPRQ